MGVTIPPVEEYELSSSGKVEDTSNEEASLVEKTTGMSLKTAQRLRLCTLVVSWLSVVLLGILGIACLALSVRESSSSLFAFSLDAILDCLSSCVVIWRFSGSAATLYSAKKEKVACIVLGVFFIISAVAITGKAAVALAQEEEPEDSTVVFVICLVNLVLCFAFFVTKTYLAVKLKSCSIATDAVNSGIGFVLAVSSIISYNVHERRPDIWYLDHVIGIVCSFVLVVYGVWIIVFEVKLNTHSDDTPTAEKYSDSKH